VGAGDKRVRYAQARGECGEVAAAVELGEVLGLLPSVEAERAVALAGRVAATLTGLVRRFR
jgi:hypothetical protein